MAKTKLLLTTFILLLAFVVQAQMVLEYDIVPANPTISLPLYGTVNVSVDWGDGSAVQTFTTAGDKNHTYTSMGTQTVTITGTLTHFGSTANFSNKKRLTKVHSWDGLGLTSLSNAFYSAISLIEVPSALPSGVTDLSYMFYSATLFNQD
ncbi:MAG TPA: hypothetical protein VK796_05415, partial [Cytophaga sp.]|nr:hypothetical protein [Cytophaga sp.]